MQDSRASTDNREDNVFLRNAATKEVDEVTITRPVWPGKDYRLSRNRNRDFSRPSHLYEMRRQP